MDSELQDAFDDVRDLCDGSEPDSLHVIVEAARKYANAATLAGGGDQWIMEWEGELIHPTDLPEGRYLVIPVTEAPDGP